jgi:hypothetical protein
MKLGQHRYVEAGTDGRTIAHFDGDVPRVGDEVSIHQTDGDGWYIVVRVLWIDDYQWSPPTHRARVFLRKVAS